MSSKSIVKDSLRKVRRRLNQLCGRDVPFRAQVHMPQLHLGSEYGGWTVQPERLSNDSIVYSVGVGEDISFDLALIQRFQCQVCAFDPTPKCIDWLRSQALPPRFRFQPIGLANYDGVARFVVPGPGKVSCHIAGEHEVQYVECPVRKLTTIMRAAGHQHIDLLKMDIEGAEYPVIDDLLKTQVRPTQLLIEFHHTIGNAPSLAKTRRTVESLNAAGYRIFDISPVGLEYSFIR